MKNWDLTELNSYLSAIYGKEDIELGEEFVD